MRSGPSRRLRSRPPHRPSVGAVARLIDEYAVDDPLPLSVHVTAENGRGGILGIRALDPGIHPFAAFAGFTAPEAWSMFGLRVQGIAHSLGDGSAESSTTFLLGRDGAEWSILRRGRGVEELPGPATGTVPDLCRRVLGRSTAPAPPTTDLLWTVAWLDQVLEAWGDPSRRRSLTGSWGDVAALHPAAPGLTDPVHHSLEDPSRLVTLGRAHAAAWPWSRLRREPAAARLPGGDLPVGITRWMDDGFYARWALGAFPAASTLARDLSLLLGDRLGRNLVDCVEALLRPAGDLQS